MRQSEAKNGSMELVHGMSQRLAGCTGALRQQEDKMRGQPNMDLGTGTLITNCPPGSDERSVTIESISMSGLKMVR
jgi:hypothetical protein